MDGSETLLSKQLGAVSEAASAAAAAGMSAAAEAAKAAKAAQFAADGVRAATQRAEDAAKALLRPARGRTWKAVLDGGAPLWCAVLCTVFLAVVLWSARRKFDELTADTSQGALRSLAAAHPEAVCLNAEMEWYGSRAERVYLACGKQGEDCGSCRQKPSGSLILSAR